VVHRVAARQRRVVVAAIVGAVLEKIVKFGILYLKELGFKLKRYSFLYKLKSKSSNLI
jgi:hypothetical protein